LIRSLASLPLLLIAPPALAQTGPELSDEDVEEQILAAAPNEILVVATRFGGQLDVPQEPIATFDEADIQALGASSVAELLTAISPQTGSGRGRGGGFPAVLVNGQRIANFREMRNYPPEAIRRVEVLPEEVALRLGFPANSRVVNMILKDQYANRRLELDYGVPTRGGFAEWEAEGTLLKIAGPSRYSFTLTAEDRSPLFESERNLTPTGAAASAPFRSLIADSREFGANASWTRGLGKDGLDGSVSLNANLGREDTRGYSGLDPVLGTVLDRIARTDTAQAGLGLNRGLGAWQLAATLDAAHTETTRRTDRGDGSALIDTAKAKSDNAPGRRSKAATPEMHSAR
jgi:iron complex outermembrane recepter protein